MGEKDTIQKTLESYNDVFADIVNVLLFNGKRVITEDSLTDAQPFSMYKMDGDARNQDRDVAKYWQNNECIRIGFYGIENQSVPDKDMALRLFGYDGAAYRAQLSEKKRTERYPVVSLVLYFGTERRWPEKRNLKDRLEIKEELAPFVNDYKPNLFELAWLTDEQIAMFKSDFHEVVEYLRAKRLRIRYEGSQKQLDHIEEILELFRVMSGDNSFHDIQEEILTEARKTTGGVKMCDVIQAIKTEGRVEGRIEGEKTATDKILSLFAKLYALGKGDDVQKATNDREYLKKLMDEYQK